MSNSNLSSSNKESLGGGEVEEYKYVNRDAIDKDLVCSICREPFIYPVCCTNDGCNWQGNRDQHNVHRKECTFEKIACDFAKFGCDFSGTRGGVETHLNDTCKFKELKLFFKAYLELEKKVQVLEKKVEHLQKGGPSSASSGPSIRSPASPFPLFIPSSLVSAQPPQTSPEEEAQLLALHQAAMRHTQSRAEQEKKEKERKEKEEKEKREKERLEKERQEREQQQQQQQQN